MRLHGLLVLVATLLALTPAAPAVAAEEVRVGEVERVEVRGTDGRWHSVLARMDTGAERSSVDPALAYRLGLRADARAELAVGDLRRSARLTVADEPATNAPLVIGRSDMRGFTVAVGERHMLAEAGPLEPPAPAQLPSTRALLAAFALAAALVVLMRTVIGMETFGVFAPVLLAMSFVLGGLGPGLLLLAITLSLSLALPRLLHALRLPRVARLAVLVAVVAIVVLALGALLGAPTGAGGLVFPIIVTAAIMERFWDLWEDDDVVEAIKRMTATVGFAVAVGAALTTELVAGAADRFAVPTIVAAGLLSLALGLYRGLRFSELLRFQPVART